MRWSIRATRLSPRTWISTRGTRHVWRPKRDRVRPPCFPTPRSPRPRRRACRWCRMRRTDRGGFVVLLALLLATSARALPPELRERLPQLPADVQHTLLAREAQWTAMTPAQRQALQQRLVALHALPPAQRRERRETWQAWQALPAADRLQVRAAALAFAAKPPPEQQALRAEFA